MAMNLKKNMDVTNAIEQERVYHAVVTRVTKDKETGALYIPLRVPLAAGDKAAVQGVIHENEIAERLPQSKRINYMVGTEVPFVIIGVAEDGETLLCSRKRAQEKLREAMLPSLQSGETFTGVITGITAYGAFVDVDGVSGFLANADYSTDHSRIHSRYRVSDSISVCCKSIGDDAQKRIAWEAVPKYHRTAPFVCDLEVGDTVLGKVVSICNFNEGPAAFVRVKGQDDLDVLCSMEIERNVSVAVRVKSVVWDSDPMAPPRLRGTILHLA